MTVEIASLPLPDASGPGAGRVETDIVRGIGEVSTVRPPWSRRIAFSLAVVLVGWVYLPNLIRLIETWRNDPNYSHGFLIIPVALAILWQRLSRAAGTAPTPVLSGWAGLIAALALRAYFDEKGEEWRETVTFIPVLASLVLSLGGWRLLGAVWPAVLFLGFMLPLPPGLNGALAQPLQRMATAGSCWLLGLTGLWVVPEGNVINIGHDRLEVAAACNGISMLMSLAMTVTATTILVPMANWKRVLIILSAVPIALGCNVLRIWATAWCYHAFGAGKGEQFAHDIAGLLMMPLSFALVILELGLLSWLVVKDDRDPGRPAHPLDFLKPAMADNPA